MYFNTCLFRAGNAVTKDRILTTYATVDEGNQWPIVSLDQLRVDVYVAEIVDQNAKPPSVIAGKNSVYQCRFAGAEVVANDDKRDVSH